MAETNASVVKIKLNVFFGYIDPEIIFLMMKISIFWGDLTDISAKKEALAKTYDETAAMWNCSYVNASASVFKIK